MVSQKAAAGRRAPTKASGRASLFPKRMYDPQEAAVYNVTQ